MFKKFAQNGARLSLFPFIKEYLNADKVEQITKTEQVADRSITLQETGWDRVKKIFEIDEFGNISYEANSVLQTAAMSLFVGAMYGGVKESKAAYTDFMRVNEATSFKNHMEAKSKLQHAVTMAFGKGSFRFGWRLALFSSTFVGLATTIQVYRGKCGLLEYVAAGGLAGFMYKFNMGPRGWIVGGGLGATLGCICGAVTLGLLKLTGLSIEETRYWQYQWRQGRKEYYRKGMAEYLEKEDFAIIKIHNDEMGKEGRHIDNIDNTVKNTKDKVGT